ncbi:MAG: DNA polymerase III subunit beta [Bacteroidia bacterium]|nr:DNA polymerase III subunit beta [Bacteroidia bacterium]MDW8157593.1 DNA polymerase III subunit beta [Bacteroidia bacterium]
MNFTVSSSELQRHLNLLTGVLPAKAALPIIQNIHFQIVEGRLQLTATDLENAVQTTLSVVVEEEGNFNIALPAKILLDTLKALPEQPLTFFFDSEKFAVKIKTDNGSYRISGYDGTDFPTMPTDTETNSIRIALPILTKAIHKTIFAVSNDELKTAMTGVFFNFKPDGTTFVATDAHRLVRYRRYDITTPEDLSFILPQKALKLLLNAANNTIEDTVRLDYNARSAFFRVGTTTIACRLIDAKFPEYENVIPKSSSNKVIIPKKDLLATMKRVHIYSNKTTHLGRFKFNGNRLEVNAEDTDFANQANENLTCRYEGQELEIGFNVSLMMELIGNAETEEVIIELENPSRAAIILPSDQDSSENMLMLLMPIMLSNNY